MCTDMSGIPPRKIAPCPTRTAPRSSWLNPDHPIRFGNHSCAPNLWLAGATSLVARRDVAAGEELTQDYATYTGVESWRMPCRCGSDGCRGVVTGRDWRLPALRWAYGDRWTPPLLARIRQLVTPTTDDRFSTTIEAEAR